jgi:hypothetical protein
MFLINLGEKNIEKYMAKIRKQNKKEKIMIKKVKKCKKYP